MSKYANKKLVIHDENDPEQLRRDRERVLELLLSKEQVVAMIYAKTAVMTAPSSPTKTTASAFGPSGSPSGMDGVVNGLLDLNFGSNNQPSWTSGSTTGLDGNTQGGDDNREDNYGDRLPAINPPGRK